MKPSSRLSTTYPASPLVTDVGSAAVFTVEQDFRLTQIDISGGLGFPIADGTVQHFDPPYALHPNQRYVLKPAGEDGPASIWLIEPVEGIEGEWQWLREADRAS